MTADAAAIAEQPDPDLDGFNRRLGAELITLAHLCSDVEAALAPVAKAGSSALGEAQITRLQHLDRMRQTLEDLARLFSLLAQSDQTQPDRDMIESALQLGSLKARLLAARSDHPAPAVGDVSWF